jgi:hypothetical protein
MNMAKILSYVRRESETRQHQRFMVPKGTFIIVSPGTDNERKVQLIDISQGGAAFIYQGSKEELDASGLFKLLAKDADLEPLNFKMVFDEPLHESMDTSLLSRRRGVKFEWMGVVEKEDLSDFLKSISM